MKPESLLPTESLMDLAFGYGEQNWNAHVASSRARDQVVEAWILSSFVVHRSILLARLNRVAR